VPHQYAVNPKHRNGSPDGSQWTIPPIEEHACFQTAEIAGWLLGDKGWGLHLVAETPAYLGVAVDGGRLLFVAKFVAGAAPVVWHGYPADPEKRTHDIPEEHVLQHWLVLNLLSKPKIRKLGRGQACRL
jgi:hypothetical protein